MAKARRIIAVYLIRNVVSGGFYIGSSGNLYERWRVHKNKLRIQAHPNPKLQASWSKHGEDAFKFEMLEEFTSVGAMENLEQALIHKHLGDPACYNLAAWVAAPMRGRTGSLHPNYGKPMSPETKALISEAVKQQWVASDPRTGRTHNEQTRALISANRTGKGAGADHYLYGQTQSPEIRKKIGDTQRGVRKAERTEAHRHNLSVANMGNQNWLGKHHSTKSKAKMSKQVLEATTGTQFISLTAALQHYRMTMPTLRRALLAGTPITKGKFTGLVFQYVDHTPIN
jgi:group I intron endonuclease